MTKETLMSPELDKRIPAALLIRDDNKVVLEGQVFEVPLGVEVNA